jgi:5-(carboxyamino)imidazole ribonucleotide synthase
MQKINKKIGVLGGGQLGKMLLEAAVPLSLDVSILDKQKDFPAGPHTNKFTEGDFTNYDDVVAFGRDKDIVTIEIEAVNEDALRTLEAQGVKVYPQPAALKIIKDKGIQKQFYQDNGFATSKFKLFDNSEAIKTAILDGKITIPFVQKSRKDGYDGKGVFVVKSISDLANLLPGPALVEDLVDINKELAVIVSRNPDGEVKCFPVVEMEFHPVANLVEFLFTPSAIDKAVEAQAIGLATAIADKMEIVGLLAVELFLDQNGNILVNEVAPRPHNSGHHTIEGCYTSQFSQLLRAILNLPLGDTSIIQPAVMINVIGEPGFTGPPIYEGLDEALSLTGVYPHLYGKAITKPYRKMGHITIMNADLEEAKRVARNIKSNFKVKA